MDSEFHIAVAGVLTRVASVFGIALMSLLWLSAGIRDHTLPFGDTSVRPSTGLSLLLVSLPSSSGSPKLDGLFGLAFDGDHWTDGCDSSRSVDEARDRLCKN